MKNTIGKHTGLKNSGAILLLVIFLVCCLTGCGEKKTAEGNGVSVPLCEKLDSHFAVSDNLISLTEADMEEMSFRSISENDFENVREKDFRNILKGLFRKYSNDYEIYATDNSDYALVVSWYGGTPSASYWLYKEYGEWHIENVEVPDTFLDTGQVENVEFHKLNGVKKELLVIQGVNNQGHGNTFVFRTSNNRLQCIGYVERSIDRNWVEPMCATEIELYAGKGNLQVAFQDIDSDGYEEMLVYGRKLIYEVEPEDEEELREVEIVKKAYNMEGEEFIEIPDPQYEIKDILNNTGMKYYHLWGIEGDVDRQVLKEVEEDGTGTLYSVDWINEMPIKKRVQTMENRINKLKILPRRYRNEKRESNIYVVTEQANEKSRVYQILQWEEGGLREVFADEYRNYTLIDEEPYLTLHRYNSYGCWIEDDMLYMNGSRLILDEEGNICGVDNKERRFQYVNGYFEPVENTD